MGMYTNVSRVSALIEQMEREAFEKWARPDSVQMHRHPETGEYTERGMCAAWEGWKARAQRQRPCRGVTHPGCDYLAPCGSICDKCGQQT